MKSFKKIAIATLQVLVSVGLIAWIFHDPTKRAAMATALATANLWWLLPGVLTVGFTLVLQTFRWQLLLRAVDIPLSWLRCARLLLIGMFFNLFLIGATGGDLAKIYYIIRESPAAKAAAFLSVVVDRIVGMLALALIALVALILRWDTFTGTALGQGMVATVALVLGGSTAVVIAGVLVAVFRLEDHLPARLPLRSTFIDLARATHRYASTPRTILAAIGLSLVGHLSMFSAFAFAAVAIGSAITSFQIFAGMPIISTVTSLPISVSGIGVREHFFEQLLALDNIPAAEAVLISILGYVMSVVWSLLGGLVFVTYRVHAGAPVPLDEIPADSQP